VAGVDGGGGNGGSGVGTVGVGIGAAGVGRHAGRAASDAGGGLGVFIIDDGGTGNLAVRVKFFLAAGDGVPIDFGGDADDGLAGAEDFSSMPSAFLLRYCSKLRRAVS